MRSGRGMKLSLFRKGRNCQVYKRQELTLVFEESPKHDWGSHSFRVLNIVDNQVRSLRKRQVIEAFKDPNNDHSGSYWGIRSRVDSYNLADSIPCPSHRTIELSQIPTRLKRLDSTV